MSGVELMDVTLASEEQTEKKVCPYFRIGYCKYKSHCKHFHPSENCEETKCRDQSCKKRHKKPCRFGQNCTRISTCEFLHKEQRRLTGTTDLDDLVKSQKALEKLIQSKDAEIKKLTLNIEKLETDIKDIQEDIQKFKTVEKRVEESEEKVSKLLSEIDYKVKLNFFINYQQLNIATTSDIDQVSIKLKPVLQELGFTKSCDNCPEVFKTDRQLRHHKKEKHTDEE